MPLLALGLNHKTAPVAARERLAFTPESAAQALRELTTAGVANEALILSTCNRTEFYAASEQPARLLEWIGAQHPLAGQPFNQYLYSYQDQDVVRHAMRVASGLDSMLLGEPQILGQVRAAYELASQVGTLGGQLQQLFQTVFSVSKQIRSDTGIGLGAVSIAYAAANLAKRIFTDLSKSTVLLVGAGETIELVAMHLANQGVRRMLIANRGLARARRLAEKLNGHSISLSDVAAYLPEADIVITAAHSALPILGKGMVERAVKQRKHKPIFMVDIAVPRNIEPEVAALEDVYLYNVDDLSELVTENLKSRQAAAQQAEAIIEIETRYFMRKLQSLNATETICDFRNKLEKIRDQELQQAQQQLAQGANPQIVLAEMARALTNKIMHTPSTQLRQAAFDGRLELLLLARTLFKL